MSRRFFFHELKLNQITDVEYGEARLCWTGEINFEEYANDMGRRLSTRSTPWLRSVQYAAAIVGLALVGIWLVAKVHATIQSRRDLASFSAARKTAVVVNPLRSVDDAIPANPVDTTLWSDERIVGYQESLVQEFDLPLAVIRIPSVDIEVPVLPGTDDVTLNRGVGWIESTSLPGTDGNFAVAGHRDGFFRGLKDVDLGTEIVVETIEGTHSYVIDDLLVVGPSDVWVLEPRDRPTVTLVTCYPFYFVGSAPQRFIVRGSLDEDDVRAEMEDVIHEVH